MIEAGYDQSQSLTDRITIMMFCANLVNYNPDLYREQVLSNGGGMMLVLVGEDLLFWKIGEEHICEKYLFVGSIFLSMTKEQGEKLTISSVVLSEQCRFRR